MKTVVYHETATLASRARKPKTGEQVFYKSIKDFDEKENAKYDEVIVLCEALKEKPKRKGKKDGVQLR